MGRKKLILLGTVCACLLISVVAYEACCNSQNSETKDPSDSTMNDKSRTENNDSSATSTPTATNSDDDTSPTTTPAHSSSSENQEDHEKAEDYVWDNSQVIDVALNGDSITVSSENAAIVDGSIIAIKSAGTYKISGTLTDGQIIVNTQDEETVRLILNGASITCADNAPIYVMDAKKVIIILADNTQNTVTDGASYTLNGDDEPNAAIFSKADLTIYGGGSLAVDANYNDGIASKDGLIIASGAITVNSVDDGIRGKDYLVVKGGQITVTANGEGFKSDNTEDATRGYVAIENGVVKITADGDAIDAETDVTILGGQVSVNSGGGSNSVTTASSAKGLKGSRSVVISGGIITANCADDAIHSNGTITINGGTFTLATGDDGIHADDSLTINNGDITITYSYEGLESAIITINSGNIHITSSDDGINVAGGIDASGMQPGPGRGGFPGQDWGDYSGDYYLYINGGYIVINAYGDGIDANGAVTMTAGKVIINGPTSNANGALDHLSFKITGGFLLAAGSSGMAQAPGATSTQYSILANFNTVSAGTIIRVESSDGTEVFTFKVSKACQSIAFSSSSLVQGKTYNIYVGGSSTGTVTDGLYSGGTYTAGAKYTSFTISSVVTRVGSYY